MNTAQYIFDSRRRLLGDSSPDSYVYHQYLSLCLTIITMVVIVFMLLITALYYCFFSRLNRFPDHQQNHDHHATTSRQANHRELEAIAVFTYGTVSLPSSTLSSECEICAICLDEYVQEDTIRVLRRCKHMFHKDCIDEWMRKRSMNFICPICRGSMIEQSVEIPGTSCGIGAAGP
ncbi:hypothetical protein Dsin_011329 [Dipteronia sinensis]|uniref:RING-type domain-containing protein n=1 Tax=Dipteronia sinensis TaxID=43782 RepID=A0AAE0EDP7_9ROSI|nr:hypothetical protein Dsin_011329 [Dipteronia sinensis]